MSEAPAAGRITVEIMPLTMTVLCRPDTVASETRSMAGGEFLIARGPDVDLVLLDPERLRS